MGRFGEVELDDVELTGQRLALRRWHTADAGRVHEIMQDRSMYDYLGLPDPYTPDAAREFVTEQGNEDRSDGTGLGCAVVERDGGRLVGSASLRLTADPEIGYWIAPDARGHGYAAEVARTLTEFGFQLGLARVRLACDVRNLASARTALAAGYSFEGVTRAGIVAAGVGDVPPRRGDLARFARLPGDSGEPVPYAFTPLPAGGLGDDVLRLRAMQPDDAAELVETDDELSRHWSFYGEPTTAEQAGQTAARAGLDWLVGSSARMAMVDVATDAFAGEVTLRKAGPPNIGGIGYVVHPLFRGRGYTTRALRLLAPWAFGAGGFARLELGAKTDNVASQRAAAGAGFDPDGVRRGRLRNPDGTFSDEVRYALLPPR